MPLPPREEQRAIVAFLKHNSENIARVANVITSQSPAYPLFDAGVSWSPPHRAYQIEFFIDNLTDQHYLTYAYDVSDTNALQWGKPRTWGVRLSAHW